MKKTGPSYISVLLVIIMIVGAVSSCGNGDVIATTSNPPSESTEDFSIDATEQVTVDETNEAVEKDSENMSEDMSEDITEEIIENPHTELVTTADSLLNQVQGGFTDGLWREFDLSNQNMSLRYVLSRDREQKVGYIKNAEGASYIENTMDVFVKMTDGYTSYASKSTADAIVNIYKFGQYYNDFRFQGQNFSNGIEILNEIPVNLGYEQVNDLTTPKIVDGVMSFSVKKAKDPYLVISRSLDIDGTLCTHVQITVKVDYADIMTVYLIADDMTGFNQSARFSFEVIPDGAFHTYTIPIDSYKKITGLRIDPDSFKIKEEIFEISDIRFVKAEENGIPDIKLENVFHTYSDKLHHEVHIATYNELRGVAEIGVETIIAADTVAKLIVKDKNGVHDTLDTVDWTSVECIGFDIVNAGIFGFILPVHEAAGMINVTLEDDKYVVTYSRSPENNTLVAVESTPNDANGKYGNDKDFILGQRIYTDIGHSFDDLIEQCYIERNPLGQKNIKVSAAYSSNASFLGYDAIRGCYEFWVGYNKLSWDYPNRHFNLNFTIKSDDQDRLCYIVAGNDLGASPCGILMDDNLLQIPVQVQLWKNFKDGDETLFNVLDSRYQEAIVPVIATSELNTYNLISPYYNWGNFPMKQLSTIQYHAPYYHVVTGGVETNCMVPWRYTNNRDVPNRLPDHRPMSAPEWPGDIQHTQGGCHSFNDYVEVYEQNILSYGPTYIDLVTKYANDDYTVIYRHIEMPQTDETRTYFTVEYIFNEDTDFSEFRNSFSFYSASSFDSAYDYQGFGYLDENNQSKLGSFDKITQSTVYLLGDKPYVTLYKLDSLNYCNVSFLVGDYEVILGGKKTDIDLAVRLGANGSAALTLDLGDVTFKAGDRIYLDLILVPWGSEETDYSNTLYPVDQNIRDVRQNTLVNPIVATPEENCTAVEYPYVPMVKTTNGNSATFTVSGGKKTDYEIPYRDSGYNVAVRIDGFKKLGVPVVEMLKNGEWISYELSSANNLDAGGHGAYFDGYGVHYNSDGTYSYSFVVNMADAEAKTFRISLLEDFEGFPWILIDESTLVTATPFRIYKDVDGVAGSVSKSWFGRIKVAEEDGIGFVSLYAHPTFNESQAAGALQNTDNEVTGQYVFFKYRLPLENKQQEGVVIDFYTSTVNPRAAAPDGFALDDEIISDGKWHVVVVDVSTFGKASIIAEADGSYKLKHVRLDPINGINDTDHRVDIAYFAVHDNLDDILSFNKDAGDSEIMLVTGQSSKLISTETGEEIKQEEEITPFNVYLSDNDLSRHKSWFDHVTTSENNGVKYSSFYAHSSKAEAQMNILNNVDGVVTGQYVFFKYRLPLENPADAVTILQFYTSTISEKAKAGESFEIVDQVKADGEWHVVAVDVSSFGKDSILVNENGEYSLKYLRFDPINGISDPSYCIDLSYFAIHDDLDEMIEYFKNTGENEFLLITGNGAEIISALR